MRMAKEDGSVIIRIKGVNLEQLKSSKFLGSTLKYNGRCTEEIKSRIANGKIAFGKIKK